MGCRGWLSMLPWRSSSAWERSIFATVQRLRIEPCVLRHLRRYRQSRSMQSEAGGQLFGTVTNSLVRISAASGPHRSDQRSRYGFRSNPTAAQRSIEAYASRGLLYLGEWHTHAENVPNPSGDDANALRAILEKSQLNTDALVLVIIGLAKSDADLGVWYMMKDRMHLERIR
jgi:integrative and conjugative element protein (TIGR02256 family)